MPSLVDRQTGEVVLARLELAETFWSRFWGLQFRKHLPPDRGLLLCPCSSLHTCFMRFSIDVVMLDEQETILAVATGVRPWRFLFCRRGTRSVIETSSGSRNWTVGQQVEIR